MVRWVRWHCPPDTGFEIRALAVWVRARYLSVTEAPNNAEFYEWMQKKRFGFVQIDKTEKRTPNSGLKVSGANHYPRAPALPCQWHRHLVTWPSPSGGSDATFYRYVQLQHILQGTHMFDRTSSSSVFCGYWMNGLINKWSKKWMNVWMYEWLNEWMNEWMNE